MHNHLDWLPLAFAGLCAGADGDDDPRLLEPAASCPPTSGRARRTSSISDADRVAGLTTPPPSTTASTSPALPFGASPATGSSRSAGSIPTRGPHEAIEIARARRAAAGRSAGSCRTSATSPSTSSRTSTGTAVRFLGSVGPRRARRGPGRGGRAAAPDRVRRAVRPVGGGVDGLRHAGRRLPARLDAEVVDEGVTGFLVDGRPPRSTPSTGPPRSTAPRAGAAAVDALLGRPHGRRLPHGLRRDPAWSLASASSSAIPEPAARCRRAGRTRSTPS